MKNKKIWFKAKRYGWGWYPCTWQGWIIILVSIIFITYMAIAFLLEEKLIEYFVSLIIVMTIVIYIAYKKGEKPRWRWGGK